MQISLAWRRVTKRDFSGPPFDQPVAPQAAAATTATPNVQAQWFTYDQDNRVLVNDGSLKNGSIIVSTATNSASNSYDAAGEETVYTTMNSSGQPLSQKNVYNIE